MARPGTLLSFDEALDVIGQRVRPLDSVESVPLESAFGRILAEQVLSDDDYPRFDNSAMDGFALGSEPEPSTVYRVVETVGAGGSSTVPLTPDTAAQVFTGAPVPPGTYGVVMQEDVVASGAGISVRVGVAGGENVRLRGSEIQPLEVLLSPGAELNPGAISLLALCGQVRVAVRAEPRVAILSTGDELIDFNESPMGSQIRDTSGPMLRALFSRWDVPVVSSRRVVDKRDALLSAMRDLAREADIVVATGGVSVGGRDFLPEILQELGEIGFHGVLMRPGKPVMFGNIGHSLVFGLPGNPASSFVSCCTFVREALRCLRGASKSPLTWVPARFGEERSAYRRDDFVRVVLDWRDGELWADPRFEQASFGLRSLAACDAIARLPAGAAVSKGDLCRVLLI